MACDNQQTSSIIFVVDVGNTHTVLGIFRDEKLVHHWRLTTRKETTSDEVINRISGLLRFSEIPAKDV